MEQEYKCKYCGKLYKSKLSKSTHESFCKNNPNRRDLSGKNNPRFGKTPPNKISKETLFNLRGIILDKSVQEIEDYKKIHKCCEMCGSTKTLCIDHDHKTNKFRGILCQSCNRFLGWYENNKEKAENYLKRKR